MLCDHCGERDASVHLTTIVDNEVRQQHLCEKCAAERGVETTVAVPKHPLSAFLHEVQSQATSPADAAKCTFCGTTMADFRATGRWGCANCYSAFEPSMRELLRRVHGNAKHAGHRYQAPAPALDENATILGELKDRLRRAIEQEQFEVAADLRDKIRVME